MIKSTELIPYEIKKRGEEAIAIYRKALDEGKREIPYCSVLILGREKGGKTSLLRQLLGKCFIKEWLSTQGIDTTRINTGACANEGDLQMNKIATTNSWHEEKGDNDLFCDALAEDLNQRLPESESLPESNIATIPETDLMKELQELVYIDRTNSTDMDKVRRRGQQTPVLKVSTPSVFTVLPSTKSTPQLQKTTAVTATKQSTRTPVENSEPTSVCRLDWKERNKLDKKIMCKQSYNPPVFLNVLDFAGQDMYRPMHHCFITRQALYLIVFELPVMHDFIQHPKNAKYNPLDDICYWIRSIDAHISAKSEKEEENMKLERVLLVGTHRNDLKDDDIPNINNFLKQKLMDSKDERYANHIFRECFGPAKYFIPVENSIDINSSEEDLCGESYLVKSGTSLVQETIQAMSKTLPHMKRPYPIKWLQFEQRLKKDSHIKGKCPIVKRKEANNIAEQSGIYDEKQQKEALQFFHDTGKIVWFGKNIEN